MPEQDTGRVDGLHPRRPGQLDQAMEQRLQRFWPSCRPTRRWSSVTGSTGGGSATRRRCSCRSSRWPSASSSRAGDRAPAPAAQERARRAPVSWRRSATSALAGAEAVARSTTRCRPTTSRAAHLGAAHPPGHGAVARAGRREQRRAGLRLADHAGDRPRRRRAPGPDHGADRRHAERRLRPAPGGRHLQPAQPVPRGDGGRAPVSCRAPRRCAAFSLSTTAGQRVPLTAFARITHEQHAAVRQPRARHARQHA